MISVPRLRPVTVIAMLFTAGVAITFAPTGKLSAQTVPRYSGNKPWIVVKLNLNDFTDKSDLILSDVDSEEDARELSRQLNDAIKGNDVGKWSFSYRKRKQDDPQLPSDPGSGPGKKIEFQKPKFVDPGSAKKDGKGSVLAGKKGRGKIGDAKVTMEFGKDGSLVVDGELTGNGKWSETETGGVYMEIAKSTFRGNIKGGSVSGLRFAKDNTRPVTEWSIDFNVEKPETNGDGPAVVKKNKGKNALVGTTWQMGPGFSNGGTRLDFYSETEVRVTPISAAGVDGGKLQTDQARVESWSQEDDGSFTISKYKKGKYQAGEKYLFIRYYLPGKPGDGETYFSGERK
jgi:hypothetical protein